MYTVPVSPTDSHRGCFTPVTSGVFAPVASSRTTRAPRSSAISSRPWRSNASPIGRSSSVATTVFDRSGAIRVTVPALRSAT